MSSSIRLARGQAEVKRLLILFIVQISYLSNVCQSQQHQQQQARLQRQQQQASSSQRPFSDSHVPDPLESGSYISLDGLSLVIVFDRPVNLSASIELVEQRLAEAAGSTTTSDDDEPEGVAPAPTQGSEWSRLRADESARSQLAPATARELSQPGADKQKRQQKSPALILNEKNETRQAKQEKLSTRQRETKKFRLKPARVKFWSSSLGNKTGRSTNVTRDNSRSAPLALLQLAESTENPRRTGRRASSSFSQMCQLEDNELDVGSLQVREGQQTPHLVAGVQLCAQLLTRKTLRLLHKFRLHNCLWASQVQFIIQLGRPIKPAASGTASSNPNNSQGIKIAFRRGTLSEQGQLGARWNEQDTSVELNKLPLEGLGVPLAPRLALTGPNQVAPCGQFSLSAHLSSPHGTQADQTVRLQWSVERVGLMLAANSTTPDLLKPNGGAEAWNSAPPSAEAIELQWRTLQELVKQQRGNNLVLSAHLLQFVPQVYEFRLQATFSTSLASFTLNATHQVGRLDFEAPVGTIYGTHLLAAEQQANTNQELALLADVQVPECAQDVKRVGLYWQVSDGRVRFEQTYAPVYLAKASTLPEQALIEFRLNLFYGIRVRKFASAATFVATGDSVLEAQISDGLLMTSVGQPSSKEDDQTSGGHQLELFGISRRPELVGRQDNFTYQWSCFDGKTGQPCQRSLKAQASASGATRYDTSAQPNAAARQQQLNAILGRPLQEAGASSAGAQPTGLLLVDRTRQRQPILKLPLRWLEADARLWIGLQRFDRHQPSQHSKTEYALVNVYPLVGGAESAPPTVSIGPVLMGRGRHRTSLRNPLTGAILLLAHTPAVIVGRLSGPRLVPDEVSFTWRIPNYLHPLHWTSKNETNPLNGLEEIVTELHLNPDLLLAQAHYQVQLGVCSGQQTSRASISVDVVQGVSQCRVEMMAKPAVSAQSPLPVGQKQQQQQSVEITSSSLVIMVNQCNIPLGLSPLTYQLYIIDTSASDAFIESSRPTSVQTGAENKSDEDDYTNEADELFYESQAQPLTAPQLSPVFFLAGMNALGLMALIQQQQQQQQQQQLGEQAAAGHHQPSMVRVRFGARVCNRLQSCKMFYSNSIEPMSLLATSANLLPTANDARNQSQALGLLASATPSERRQQQIENNDQAITALRGMLDGARRAHVAGSPIAAISVLSAVMSLGQRLLQQTTSAVASSERLATTKRQNYRQTDDNENGEREADQSGSMAESNNRDNETKTASAQVAPGSLDEPQLERLRDLLQAAMRDCLHYGAQSIQRQFRYTESGQTNLVLVALSRVLTLPHDNLEFKLRALRLIALLVRKSIGQSFEDRRLESLPDFKSIQATYESLFSTFGQHSVDSLLAATTPGPSLERRHKRRHEANRLAESDANINDGSSSSSASRNNNNNNNNNDQLVSNQSISGLNGNNRMLPSSLAPDPWGGVTVHSNNGLLQHRAQTATSSSESMMTPAASSTATSVVSGLKLSTSRRHKEEEAILTYLRLVRHAHLALLQAAASQLPLGAVQQFEYQSGGSHLPQLTPSSAPFPTLQSEAATETASAQKSTDSDVDKNKQQQPQHAHPARLIWWQQPAANIVSSLTHQTDLLSDTIDVDLHEFGSVSVRFVSKGKQQEGGAEVLRKLAQELSKSNVRCRNDTQTKCSSFVLSLTSFAGKAPFRSLDSSQPLLRRTSSKVPQRPGQQQQQRQRRPAPLRVPVIQIDWLSPVDGSSLIDLLRLDPDPAGPSLADFKAKVTFTLPAPSNSGTDDQDTAASSTDANGNADGEGAKYKCYEFVEGSNEWLEVAQEQAKSGGGSGAQQEDERRITCTFDGFGVLSAFQGTPPAPESSIELTIALGVAGCLVLVAFFSLLGCLSANSKARRELGQQQQQQQRGLGRGVAEDLDDGSRSGTLSYESDYGTTERRRHHLR